MTLDRAHWRIRRYRQTLIGVMTGLAVFGAVLTGQAYADPAADALAKMNELSRQAEQTTEAMHSAQLDLNSKLAIQQAAESKHAGDLAAVEAARHRLADYQGKVDKLAAAQYMGGRASGFDAMLTASSPQSLIDQMSVQRVMATEMQSQMAAFRDAGTQAEIAEQASAASATEAKTAAEQAAAVRADLQSKQSQLQTQIAIVKAQYEALTPTQRETLAAAPPPPPVPAALPVPPAPGQDPAILAAPPAPPVPGAIPPGDIAPPGSPAATTVIQAALSRIGSPYSWGGSGPGAFDCSGLVMWSFQQAGIALPHSSQALARGGQPVSTDQMQPGDLVTYYSDASHVGIYIGDGMMVHASTYGTPVRVAPVNNAPIYNVRRY
ncbi:MULTISPECIES: peptidoglycan hydrolase RipC [Mycolicibacterium]|uniref:Cell wall-associated hydrolase, invasion-associated protein n=2 Tax=Mycolicibacterium gilvum TaxID=1804 RepID=E6TG84_MYCSR|nr:MULTISPECIES: peptidoglycan hydrolase RipC [Mycolicibacterium]ABP45436.1 NLP/P60 protein [Mycolicibacterium gilvum PYR-GCK]ADT98937.1 cell wall-associated hydrolase, invasion-associated protein [Mycolicibacterium gilvum Spyr1]MBV5243268.1 peptidoglycan hydrolase RipC [Mycolicibacterium sp. PAM1]